MLRRTGLVWKVSAIRGKAVATIVESRLCMKNAQAMIREMKRGWDPLSEAGSPTRLIFPAITSLPRYRPCVASMKTCDQVPSRCGCPVRQITEPVTRRKKRPFNWQEGIATR